MTEWSLGPQQTGSLRKWGHLDKLRRNLLLWRNGCCQLITLCCSHILWGSGPAGDWSTMSVAIRFREDPGTAEYCYLVATCREGGAQLETDQPCPWQSDSVASWSPTNSIPMGMGEFATWIQFSGTKKTERGHFRSSCSGNSRRTQQPPSSVAWSNVASKPDGKWS